ncbi:MAG: hypothetical protein RBS36_07655 [Thiomicrospira sp.]|jgi:hypothetical protein|nr:hypothetical protein [Thiomicrospira sp.]
MTTPNFKSETRYFADALANLLQSVERDLRTSSEPRTLIELNETTRPAQWLAFFDDWQRHLAQRLDQIPSAMNEIAQADAFCSALNTQFSRGIEVKRQLQHALISDSRYIDIQNQLLTKVSQQLSSSLSDFERLVQSIKGEPKEWQQQSETFELNLSFTVVDTDDIRWSIPPTTGEALADAFSVKNLLTGALKGMAFVVFAIVLLSTCAGS